MYRLQLKLSRQRQPIALRVFKQKAARRSGTSVEKRRQALDGEARHQERNGQLRFLKLRNTFRQFFLSPGYRFELHVHCQLQ